MICFRAPIDLYHVDGIRGRPPFPAFIKANLSGADRYLSRAQKISLSDARLSDSIMVWADLSDADLGEAKPVKANLRGASLIRAQLDKADLTEANLSGANLPQAFLPEVRLVGANLSEADLTGANLTDAQLAGAIFKGANPSRVKMGQFSLADDIVIDDSCRNQGAIRAAMVLLSRAQTLDEADLPEPVRLELYEKQPYLFFQPDAR